MNRPRYYLLGTGMFRLLNFTGVCSIKWDNSAACVRVKLGCAKNIQHWPLLGTLWAAVNGRSSVSFLRSVLVSFSLAALPHMLTCSLLCPQHPHCVACEWGCINVWQVRIALQMQDSCVSSTASSYSSFLHEYMNVAKPATKGLLWNTSEVFYTLKFLFIW